MVLLGGTAAVAAGFATVTVIAGVFGTTGAGLAGYKMARRTQKIEEFEFVQSGKKGQLAVIIMISGWMQDDEDYKRAFGIVPSHMELNEIMTRFYQVNDPKRVATVVDDLNSSERNPEGFIEAILMKYDMSPLNQCHLNPPYADTTLSQNNYELLESRVKAIGLNSERELSSLSSAPESHDRKTKVVLKEPIEKQSMFNKATGSVFKFASSFRSTPDDKSDSSDTAEPPLFPPIGSKISQYSSQDDDGSICLKTTTSRQDILVMDQLSHSAKEIASLEAEFANETGNSTKPSSQEAAEEFETEDFRNLLAAQHW